MMCMMYAYDMTYDLILDMHTQTSCHMTMSTGSTIYAYYILRSTMMSIIDHPIIRSSDHRVHVMYMYAYEIS